MAATFMHLSERATRADDDSMTEPSDNDLYGDSVYESGDAVEDTEDLDPLEALTGDDPDETMQTGYDPPDREPYDLRHAPTAFDEVHGRPLDERLAAEVPDPAVQLLADEDRDEFDQPDRRGADNFAAPDPRAGRLVAPDEGSHSDVDKDEIALDVGPGGYGASAEEAAMHIVEDPEDELLP